MKQKKDKNLVMLNKYNECENGEANINNENIYQRK